MTDIKLMNFGRGAGKTHTLRNWQLKDPKNRFIVCSLGNVSDFPGVNHGRLYIYKQYASYDGMRGMGVVEVAFDNLDLANLIHLEVFSTIMGYHPKTVILATSYETMPAEAETLRTTQYGDLIIDGKIQTDKLEAESEPTQSVKARDLRLGDWVVGKGRVVSLTENLFNYIVETKDKGAGNYVSVSSIEMTGDGVVDVDTTKRK